MNWAPYVITAVLLIAVILEYRLKHIATDRRTTKHKVLRRWLLGIMIIGIISQQTVSKIKETQRKQEEAAKEAATEETRKRQESEILALRNILATNTLLSPEFRAKLLDVPPHEIESSDDVNLSAWRAAKQKRLALAYLQQESRKREQEQAARPIWQTARPVYEYAIQRLVGMLTQLATKRGQKVVSTFKGIPPDLTEAELGNFKIGTNDHWNISVVSFARPYISLRSGAVHLNLEVFEKTITHNYGCSSSRTNFHACVDAGLREFFIAVSEQEEPLKVP